MAYVYTLEPVPVTRRYRNLLLTERTERQLGARVFEQVKQQSLGNRTLLRPSDARTQRVRRVGKRIAVAVERLRKKLATSGEAHRHLRALDWEFIVVNSEQVNAFVVPGGKVCVFSGLLRRCRSDDELATVIGHEAAHVVARHTNENLTTGALFTAIRLMLALALDVSFLGSAAVSVLFELPMSRRNELEADRIGLELMSDACYDPRASARVYAMLGDGGADHMTFLSTHPPSQARIEQIKKLTPGAIEKFERQCGSMRSRLIPGGVSRLSNSSVVL